MEEQQIKKYVHCVLLIHTNAGQLLKVTLDGIPN
jgi:hypothetical protein